MLLKSDNDKPPTSKEEATARRTRPPAEKYDPGKLSDWSITMTLAWIVRRDLDAVRNEWDDYREKCADWVFEDDPIARTQIGLIGPQKGSWNRHQWPLSGWGRLRLAEQLKNLREPRQQAILPLQDAIKELWLAAREGRIKATALEYENVKAYVGTPIEIPAHYWTYLKRTDDPSSGKAMLSAPDGRVYPEVRFLQSDIKGLWPPLSAKQEQASEEMELKEPKDWIVDVRSDSPQGKKELRGAYAARLYALMQEAHRAGHVTKLWPLKTLRRRLYD